MVPGRQGASLKATACKMSEKDKDATASSPFKSKENAAKPAAPSFPGASPIKKEPATPQSWAPTGRSSRTPTGACGASPPTTTTATAPPPAGTTRGAVKSSNGPTPKSGRVANLARVKAQGGAPSDAGSVPKARPGRPPVSIEKRLGQLDQQWKEAVEDDVLFFGKDSRAGAKRIKDLEQAALAKISQVAIEDTSPHCDSQARAQHHAD